MNCQQLHFYQHQHIRARGQPVLTFTIRRMSGNNSHQSRHNHYSQAGTEITDHSFIANRSATIQQATIIHDNHTRLLAEHQDQNENGGKWLMATTPKSLFCTVQCKHKTTEIECNGCKTQEIRQINRQIYGQCNIDNRTCRIQPRLTTTSGGPIEQLQPLVQDLSKIWGEQTKLLGGGKRW